MKNFLKTDGLLTSEISKLVNEICENCVVCKTYQKPSPTIGSLR